MTISHEIHWFSVATESRPPVTEFGACQTVIRQLLAVVQAHGQTSEGLNKLQIFRGSLDTHLPSSTYVNLISYGKCKSCPKLGINLSIGPCQAGLGPIHSCQQKYRPKALFSWGKASPRALNPKSSRVSTWKASYLRCDSFPLHPFTSADHPDLFCQNIIKIYVHLSIWLIMQTAC